jgi:hypothetical protein
MGNVSLGRHSVLLRLDEIELHAHEEPGSRTVVELCQAARDLVQEVTALQDRVDALELAREELEETLSRTCEMPDDDCQCAGCLALAEYAAKENAKS